MARLFDDAASDYLELGSTPVTAVPLTLAAWFSKNDGAIGRTVLAISNNTPTVDKFSLFFNTIEDVNAEATSTTANGFAVSSGAGTIDTWTHGAAVFESTTSRTVYRDGANSATDNTAVTPSGLNSITVGCKYIATGRSHFWSGDIAEAAIWNRALSAAEVAALAKGYSPLWMPNGLVFYCPLIRPLSNYNGTAPTATGTTVSDHPRIIYPPWRSGFSAAAAAAAYTPRMALMGMG